MDISGLIKKETLFKTKSIPMPKNNYTVEVQNMRKAGLFAKDYDFVLINFKNFLDRHNSFYMSPKNFNLTYKSANDTTYTKIFAKPKSKSPDSDFQGYYIVNNENFNFEQASTKTVYFDDYTVVNKDLKNKTNSFEVTSNFKKNPFTNKMQINKSFFKIKVDVLFKDIKDEFDLNFIYYAEPLNNSTSIKNNINHDKDIFDLKFDYDEEYWKNQEILLHIRLASSRRNACYY